MKIQLIHLGLPPAERRHQFMRAPRLAQLGIKGIVSNRPCLSLLYLASGLQIDGHEVEYIEATSERSETYMKPFISGSPDCVGMTSYAANWRQTLSAIGEMRAIKPKTVFIAGGFHASSIGADSLASEPAPDVVFAGEAEEAIREWAKVYDSPESWDSVPGIYFRREDQVAFTGERKPPADLDRIPFPAWELVNLKNYRPAPNDYFRLPHASFIGSRGCKHSCVFCPSASQVRLRSADNMLEEIGWLKRYHSVKDLIFWDESILISPERTAALCEKMIEQKIDLTWTANARVDEVEPGILKLMRSAGCRQLLFGIESGVRKNIDYLCKGFDIDQVRAAVSKANNAGILALGMFMFGIPGETYEEALQTIDFARSLNLSHASFVYFTPYPGTELNKTISESKKGTLLKDAPFDMKAPSYIPEEMTKDMLVSLQTTAFKRFYLRPGEIVKQIKANLNRYKIRDGIQGILTLLFS